MANCPVCNTSLPEGAKFCSSCGAPMQIQETPVNESVDYQQQQYQQYQQPQYQQQYQQPQYQQPQYQQPQYQQPQYQQPQYQQPQYQQAPQQGIGYKAPIQKREIGIAILLSLVTCGIYGLYWLYHITEDLNTASQETGDTNGSTVVLLTLVTCGIYGWYWLYKAGKKVDKIKQLNGLPPADSSVLYLVLAIVQLSIVDYCLIQIELNNVASITQAQ